MKKHLRTAALILALVFALSVLFSLAFITIEADHDCIGEDCHICAVIALCRNILRTAASLLVTAAIAMAIFRVADTYIIPFGAYVRRGTPFILRDRLLN